MENKKENKLETTPKTADNKNPASSEQRNDKTAVVKTNVTKEEKMAEILAREREEKIKKFDLDEKEKVAKALHEYAEKRAGFFGKRLKTPKKIMKAITAAAVTVPVCLLDTAFSPIRLLKGMFRIANPLTTISGFGDIGRYIKDTLRQTHHDLFSPVYKKKQ